MVPAEEHLVFVILFQLFCFIAGSPAEVFVRVADGIVKIFRLLRQIDRDRIRRGNGETTFRDQGTGKIIGDHTAVERRDVIKSGRFFVVHKGDQCGVGSPVMVACVIQLRIGSGCIEVVS